MRPVRQCRVVIDTSKYLDHVLEIDAAGKTARVEPGVVCDALRDAAEQHALTFGPDPATHTAAPWRHDRQQFVRRAFGDGGKTAENIEALEILTYDGTRMWVARPRIGNWSRSFAPAAAAAKFTGSSKPCATNMPI